MGSNFVGANKELRNVPSMTVYVDSITKQAIHPIEWKYSPADAPHFGGLWEAGMKTMKLLLRKNVGSQPLSFEELTTIFAVSESVLVASQYPTYGRRYDVNPRTLPHRKTTPSSTLQDLRGFVHLLPKRC